MRWQPVFTVARAELRHTRRLVRYWLFLILSFFIGIVAYFYYATLHGMFSSQSATVASIGPRFLVSAFGFYYFLIFMVGVVFLGFDVRARDRRERMVEVLDSRPYTNLELVAGRFLGILVAVWVPVFVLVNIWQMFGFLLPAIGSPVGEPIEMYSLIAFTFFMTLPGLAFVLALVFLVTLLVRNRLIAVVLLLSILGFDFWASIWLPLIYGPICDISGAYIVNFPSEIIPGIADLVGWLQRSAMLLATLGMLGFAAAIHPRLDRGPRGKIAFRAAGLLVLAAALSGYGVYQRSSNLKQIETWREAHATQTGGAIPDLQSISGQVKIDPGRDLRLELDLVFRAPPGEPLESPLFTLNPGLEVTAVRDVSNHDMTFKHQNGLLALQLPAPLEPGVEAKIHLSIEGLPDRRFAYLRSTRTPEAMQAAQGQLFLLGFERAIYDRRFVALMPGIRWLPASGSEKDRDDPGRREVDFFHVNLTVELPSGWSAAGPGRRREILGPSGGARFRFAPPAPVPEVALIASRFESRSVEIEGVLMEILVHPKHTRNLESLADSADEIRTWLEERLREAKESGLDYPYDALSLVEVPNALRGYAGGWRMDTALAPPAMVLMRELSFPTARFDTPFRNPKRYKDREGGVPRAKRDRIRDFFINDFSGGNIFVCAARNFFLHQTSAAGPEGLALNFVMETLSTRLLTETRGYFSAHLFDAEMGQTVGETMQMFFTNPSSGRAFADILIEAVTSRPHVWDTALGVALKDLDPWEDPSRTVDVLTLKGGAVAQSILDSLGPEKTRKLLAFLRENHKGQAFSYGDLVAAGRTLEEDLDALLGDWLGSTELPGFVGTSVQVYRLPESEKGTSRYQILVHVRNDEPVPGLFRIHYRLGRGGGSEVVHSKPIRMGGRSAIRFAAISSRQPTSIFIEPYLSLNRTSFEVPFNGVDEEKIVNQEPIEGIEDVPWEKPEDEFIVVDDLDGGFNIKITDGDESKGLRLGARKVDTEDLETDQGLPVHRFGMPPSTWSRMVNPQCWGKYRHTMAVVRGGAGKRSAIFTANIPHPGSWDLELHMVNKSGIFPVRTWGTWQLTLIDGAERREVTFDSDAGAQGWNLVGAFQLPQGEITVELSDRTNGRIVVADAIRWSLSAGRQGKGEP